MKFAEKDYDDIAGELETGMVCYIHKESGKLETVPEEIEDFDSDLLWEESEGQESWGKMLQRFENNPDDYYVLEPMGSREAFRIMEDFARTEIGDEKFQEKVLRALNGKGPFRSFRNLVEEDFKYRQQWFDFRNKRYRRYVKDAIDSAKGDT